MAQAARKTARIETAAQAPRPAVRKASNVAIGRDGKPIVRATGVAIEPTYVPPELIPDGWDYQWEAVSVFGEQQTVAQTRAYRAGWRPVPASRHDGLYMPLGHDGPIIIDGLMLMERPMELTMHAREEEYRKARGQQEESHAQFGMKVPAGSGFSTETPGARSATFAKSSYESIADLPGSTLPDISVDGE